LLPKIECVKVVNDAETKVRVEWKNYEYEFKLDIHWNENVIIFFFSVF